MIWPALEKLAENFPDLTSLDLQPSLIADPLIGSSCAARRLPGQGQRRDGERRYSFDSVPLQLLDLQLRRAADQRQVIVRPSAAIATFSLDGSAMGPQTPAIFLEQSSLNSES